MKTEADVLKEMTGIITKPTKAQEWLNSDKVTKFCEESRKERKEERLENDKSR